MLPNHLRKIYGKYLKRHGITDRLPQYDFPGGNIIVVIPAFREKDYIFDTLRSLSDSSAGTTGNISVIVVINASETAGDTVRKEQEELYRLLVSYSGSVEVPNLHIFPLKELDMPKKHAGVGYARKLGMDQAVLWFVNSGIYDGVIVSLDADAVVAPNYFEEIEKYFSGEKRTGCSIYFEHPFMGDGKEAIALYELHLRYYKQALRFAGFPYAYHTVGSAFAVRAANYVMAGGMPRKQAGEDFYLIQKIVQSGGYGELNTTCVYPSSRPSDRVPFGTGPAVKKMMENQTNFLTYHLDPILELKSFFDLKYDLFNTTKERYDEVLSSLSDGLREFLVWDDFFSQIVFVNENCSTKDVFGKRFFEVFNAFKIVKYLNFVHGKHYSKVPVADAALSLLEKMNSDVPPSGDAENLLGVFRDIDRHG